MRCEAKAEPFSAFCAFHERSESAHVDLIVDRVLPHGVMIDRDQYGELIVRPMNVAEASRGQRPEYPRSRLYEFVRAALGLR
jgi:hypothetical protein